MRRAVPMSSSASVVMPKNRPMAMKIAPAPRSLRLKVIACLSPWAEKTGAARDRAGKGLSEIRSVGVDAGRLDQRLPARDLGLDLGLERGRRRVLLRLRRGGERGEAVDHVLVLKRELERLAQAIDDRSVRALGRVDAVPD